MPERDLSPTGADLWKTDLTPYSAYRTKNTRAKT
jgi:hypothetical protein